MNGSLQSKRKVFQWSQVHPQINIGATAALHEPGEQPPCSFVWFNLNSSLPRTLVEFKCPLCWDVQVFVLQTRAEESLFVFKVRLHPRPCSTLFFKGEHHTFNRGVGPPRRKNCLVREACFAGPQSEHSHNAVLEKCKKHLPMVCKGCGLKRQCGCPVDVGPELGVRPVRAVGRAKGVRQQQRHDIDTSQGEFLAFPPGWRRRSRATQQQSALSKR